MESLAARIGPDTISRLERAFSRRFAEAEWLARGEHRLASIYFFGYAAEIVLGAAFFRLRGYGKTEPIEDTERRRIVKEAQKLKGCTKSYVCLGSRRRSIRWIMAM